MKLINLKELYDNAVATLGLKKVLIVLSSGLAGWCICSTAALAIVPDSPQIQEAVQTVTENIIEKENV